MTIGLRISRILAQHVQAYDVHVQFYRQERWRIFDNKEAAVGKMAEESKRQGILELLYTARRNQPTSPTLNLHELESLLG